MSNRSAKVSEEIRKEITIIKKRNMIKIQWRSLLPESWSAASHTVDARGNVADTATTEFYADASSAIRTGLTALTHQRSC